VAAGEILYRSTWQESKQYTADCCASYMTDGFYRDFQGIELVG